jgi:phosphoglucosamine mutase
MFGTSGIRGPVGETVTGTLALDLGRAIGSDIDRIVVGRDARESGETLARAAMAGAQEVGCDVVDLGVQSTPTVARSVDRYNAAAGLVVTASHNPPTDNGFKCWQRSAQAFGPDRNDDLERRIERSDALTVSPAAMGTVWSADDAAQRQLEALPGGNLGSLSVVVDVGHGTGALSADALLEVGCDVTTIDAQCDGSFPGRPSEPTAEHCETLEAVVPAIDADLGIAHDGDADRTMAVDETGRFVSGDELLALFAMDVVSNDAAIAVPINASALIERVVEDAGGSVVRTAVGDVNVAQACTDPAVVFGGEPSGAWIWPAETLAPDGHYAACRLARIVADGQSLGERLESFPQYVTRRESIACAEKVSTVAAVEDRIRDRYDDVVDIDGVRVDVDDGWFLIRASGTEPLVRVTAEARTVDRADELRTVATSLVQEVVSDAPVQ